MIWLLLGIICLIYTAWLHIEYQNKRRSRREAEEERFRNNMYRLGYDTEYTDDILSELKTLSDLCEANKKLEKGLKKYKI